jgi:hypothetical protein
MMPFFQQVFSLLASDPGNLTYHLVLAFSIAGALQMAIIKDWGEDINRGRRLLFGLSLLLLLRVALFVGAGLAWQRISQAEQLLPLLDRAISFLGAILIVWLWVYPEPKRAVDWMVALTGLLMLTVSLWGILLWLSRGENLVLNGSWFDLAASGITAVFLFLGCILLIVRRQVG